jgi:quercetin dioxygenase-like cupin family protein
VARGVLDSRDRDWDHCHGARFRAKIDAGDEMADTYTFIQDLSGHTKVPENGILSQAVQNDDRSKVVLFGFAAGQELSAHTAPYPATLTFLKGEASLRLGADEKDAAEGTFVYMPAYLEHGIKAKTDVVLLLTMIKK